MKEIVREYGTAILAFTIGGLILIVIIGIVLWGRGSITGDVRAEELISGGSNGQYEAVVNAKLPLRVKTDVELDKPINVKELVTGADNVRVIKVEQKDMVEIDGGNITFTKPGVVNMYVDTSLNTGESQRAWIAVGVDG